MSEQLVITALGKDRPGIVEALSDALTSRQMNIEDSRMSMLGGEFAIMLLVSGSDEAIHDFIGELAGLEKTLDMNLMAKTTIPLEEQSSRW
jgi:glycine cleavage system transcriptional repressor